MFDVVEYNKNVINKNGVYFTRRQVQKRNRRSRVLKSQQNVSCFLVTEAGEQAPADELQWYHYIIDLELQESLGPSPVSSQANSPLPSQANSPASSQTNSPASSSPVIASSQANSSAVLISSPVTLHPQLSSHSISHHQSHETNPF